MHSRDFIQRGVQKVPRVSQLSLLLVLGSTCAQGASPRSAILDLVSRGTQSCECEGLD